MKIRYSESIVLFIDVLGFSNLVYNKDKTKIESYFTYILADYNNSLSEKKFNNIIISDSIVVSAKKTKENLSELIFVIGKIQYQLFLKGILIRGALSFGKLYINKSNNLIIGPGLINAYKLEKSAIYPRIIIDRQIIPELFDSTLAFMAYLNSYYYKKYGETESKVKFDSALKDGKPYFNLMRNVVRYGSSFSTKNFKSIVDFFSANYFSNEHFEKYHWLLEELKAELLLGIKHYEEHKEIKKSLIKINKLKLLHDKLSSI